MKMETIHWLIDGLTVGTGSLGSGLCTLGSHGLVESRFVLMFEVWVTFLIAVC